ncbi:hypothetical protein [Chelativorans sp. J32]
MPGRAQPLRGACGSLPPQKFAGTLSHIGRRTCPCACQT